jgi:hypothetical protein
MFSLLLEGNRTLFDMTFRAQKTAHPKVFCVSCVHCRRKMFAQLLPFNYGGDTHTNELIKELYDICH